MLDQRSQRITLPRTLDIVFQAVSWHAQDVDFADIDGEEDPNMDHTKYVIKCFGSTIDGKTVSVTIKDFTPYFYVRISDTWTAREAQMFKEFLCTKLPYRMHNAIVSVKILKRKDFWGFTNQKTFNFIRICVRNIKAMRFLVKTLQGECLIRQISQRPFKFKLYESNIDPYIRFMHINDIEPCGWIQINHGDYTSHTEVLPSNCQIDVEAHWSKVTQHQNDHIAPFLVASFDIECSSMSGDFPVPKKDYKKVASDLYEVFTTKIKKELDEYKKKQLVITCIKYALGIDTECEFTDTMHRVQAKSSFKASRVSTDLNMHIDDIFVILSGKNISGGIPGEPPNREKIVGALTRKLSDEHLGLPSLSGDPIIQIGTTYHTFGAKECCFRHIITLGSCDPIEGATVEACESEEELLLKWRKLIQRTNPDALIGFNIFGFDMVYMHERAEELGIKNEFMKLGRFSEVISNFKEAKLSSSALGDNILKFIDMEGRVLIDIMKVVQRDHKLDSYKLDNVAHHFMGMNKHDVSPQDIIRLQKGTSADRKVIAEYCIQDCALCNHLTMKLEILANNMGMANVCLVPLSFIFMRGQGIKIFSLVLKQCKEDGYLIPVIKPPSTFGAPLPPPEEEAEEDGYEGAIVLEPKEGIYIDDPVSVLDYASLYPSSMISENLSHDCIVLDKQYDNLPGVEYLDITYDIYEGVGDKKVKSGERVCRYVQFPEGKKGIIPTILMKLLKARKTTRKKMEMSLVKTKDGAEYRGFYDEVKCVVTTLEGEATTLDHNVIESAEDLYNEFQKAVLDGLQLAYKVTANSLYGQIGAKTSPIYLKDIAACTTATGRKMIMMAKEFLEKNYNANIVYGDSVTGDTPLLVKYPDGMIDIVTIENLAESAWEPYERFKPWDTHSMCDKQKAFVNAQVWTGECWAGIRKVIRHKTTKDMYQVNTFRGCVKVTADHSLVHIHGNEIKPTDCVVGETEIMHGFPKEFIEIEQNAQNVGDLTQQEAWVWGLFLGDGICEQSTDTIITSSWAIHGNNKDILKEAMACLQMSEAGREMKFKIIDTFQSSHLYKLVPLGHVQYMVDKYHTLFYGQENQRHVPKCILNASGPVRKAFFDGYFVTEVAMGQNEEESFKGFAFACQGKTCAQGLYYITKSLGYTHLRIMNSYSDIYWISERSDWCFEQHQNKVMDMRQLDACERMVYDLETEIGHFQAGIGEMVVFNTDSIFVVFPNTTFEATIDLTHNQVMTLKGKSKIMPSIKTAIAASKIFKKTIKAPHDLEYEKTFWPFVLLSKKRYVGNLYEMDDKKYKQKSMGIVLKRRDNAPIVKRVYGGIIDIILGKQDIQASVDFLQTTLKELVDGTCPLEDLIISKSLRAEYKDPTRIAHKVLAERMGQRDAGNKPQVNDRIPYVYICPPEGTPSKAKVLQGDRIEHPDYIRKNKIRPDYGFYITNQIMKPVLQVYGIVADQIKGNRNSKDYYEEQVDKYMRELKDTKRTKDKISQMREDDVKKVLFDPILARLENIKNKNREITDWFKPTKSLI